MNSDKNLAIAFLVHDEVDSAHCALATLNRLFKCTDIPYGTDFYVVINGHNDDVEDVINLFVRAYEPQVNFIIHQFEENTGCSSGVNHLANLTKDYKYTLFLERDWILLGDTPRTWLKSAIKYLDATEVDMVYLRRLTSSLETRQYYGVDAFTVDSKYEYEGFKGRHTSMRIYTNNPHLRRNKKFFDEGVLPLPEVKSETKLNPNWGNAEIAHEHLPANFVTIYQEFGFFVHYHPNLFDQSNEFGHAPAMHAIFRRPLPCEDGCKYGFLNEDEPDWCKLCQLHNTSYCDIEQKYVEMKS